MPPIVCDVALGLMATLFSAMFFYFGRDGKKYHAKVKTDVETKERLKTYFQMDFAFACIMVVISIFYIARAIYRICII